MINEWTVISFISAWLIYLFSYYQLKYFSVKIGLLPNKKIFIGFLMYIKKNYRKYTFR